LQSENKDIVKKGNEVDRTGSDNSAVTVETSLAIIENENQR
jgi:hypothetical protein